MEKNGKYLIAGLVKQHKQDEIYRQSGALSALCCMAVSTIKSEKEYAIQEIKRLIAEGREIVQNQAKE
jgi:hypothetical protein